jgi:hypothetical protein
MKFPSGKSLLKIVKIINPNYFSFISGITVSIALNVYTNMLWADKKESVVGVLISCALLILSAFFFVSLSLELQTLRELSAIDAPNFLNEKERDSIFSKLINQASKKMLLLVLFSMVTGILGLILLWIVI